MEELNILKHANPVAIILTVNPTETSAVLDAFLGKQNPREISILGHQYNDLGIHGNHRIYHAISKMGSINRGASAEVTSNVIKHLKPQKIIAVGVALGLHQKKHKIGDVLIAEKIICYEPARLNPNRTRFNRGDEHIATPAIVNSLRIIDGNRRRAKAEWPTVKFGSVLSGEKLVDDEIFRDQLKVEFPEAIGGEMEGCGIAAKSSEFGVEWVLIKGICDWGMNKSRNKSKNQEIAAMNAAQVARAYFEGTSSETPPEIPQISADPNINISRLPATSTNFFGREQELNTLIEHLGDSSRVIQIVARGGEGKPVS